jgi:hypothetical protein
MRLHATLSGIALLATAGCSGSAVPVSDAGNTPGDDALGSSGGGSSGGSSGTGGQGCGSPQVTSGTATPQQACQIAHDTYTSYGPACQNFCSQLNSGDSTSFYCSPSEAYGTAYLSAQGDAGISDAGPTCPAWSGDVVISCGYACFGRRTEGVVDPEPSHHPSLGSVFADRAYLEKVSVHAFARLERELAAHGAPPSLIRQARRAQRDETRHTAMMARLARRHGTTPRSPKPPSASPVRSLFAVAFENAVEGCLRETYGAVVGLVEARVSSDRCVRRAMRTISVDECRHAELALAIAAWILPRLTAHERDAIDRATKATIAALARDGDARIVELLASRVWNANPVGAETVLREHRAEELRVVATALPTPPVRRRARSSSA